MKWWPFSKKTQTPSDAGVKSDSFQNTATGFGVQGYDPRLSSTPGPIHIVTPNEAESLWRDNDVAAKAIEFHPREAVRQGFEVTIGADYKHDKNELRQAIRDKWATLNTISKIRRWHQKGRGYGGSVIILGAQDGRNMDEPLSLQTVRSLDYLTVLDCRDITPVRDYANIFEPKFGEPEIYQIAASSARPGRERHTNVARIHESRMIIHPGIEVSRHGQGALPGWGDSILTRMYAVLRDFDQSWSSAAVLMTKFAQRIIAIDGFYELAANNEWKTIQRIIEAQAMGESMLRSLVIDQNDQVSRSTTPLTGVPDMMKLFMQRSAGAADMSVTSLMGMSPAGMNATGESDITQDENRIKAEQDEYTLPALERITRLIIISLLGFENEPFWNVEANPLRQPTLKEQKDNERTQAEIDWGYLDRGVIGPAEIAVSRYGGDEGFSFDTTIDQKAMLETLQGGGDLDDDEEG